MAAMIRFVITCYFFVIMFCRFVVLHSSIESNEPFFQSCGDEDSNNNQTDLKILFDKLIPEAKRSGFSKDTINIGSLNQINGLIMCYKDSLLQDCLDCLDIATKTATTLCPDSSTATFTYARCFLRYSKNENFFGTVTFDEPPKPYFNQEKVKSNTMLSKTVPELFKLLRQQAMSSPELYANSSQIDPGLNQMVYGLVQCAKDLDLTGCDLCLQNLTSYLINLSEVPKGVRVSYPNCYIRYELYPLSLLSFNSPAPAPAPALEPSQPIPLPPPATTRSRGPRTMRVKVIAFSAFGAFLCITLASICFWRMRRTKQNERLGSVSTRRSREEEEISLNGSVQGDFRVFLLSELKFATCNFSEDNKLGVGGFGPVYKGILPDGKEIAVKRLAGHAKQGFAEFKIEVELLAKLKHKNLVKLHGYCMEKNEKLLCYEYLPCKSLDVFLFVNDKIKREKLPWQTRYKIIKGISSGLQYLHRECGLKIVHRDLKPSNILLDGDMNPKISDFGLARLFPDDQSHMVTLKFAGTFGYLAPEYSTDWKYSEKSDVYSFRIMLLEIITGKNNRFFTDDRNACKITTYVWQHWERGEVELLKDPALEDICLNQLSRCIHIGLLCVQHNPNNRPYIDVVNRALNDDSVAVPAVPSFMSSQEYLLSQISQSSTSDNNLTPGDFTTHCDRKEFGHSMSSNDIAGDKYVPGIEMAAMPLRRKTT